MKNISLFFQPNTYFMYRCLSILYFLVCFTYQLSAQCPRETVIDNYQNQYLPAQFTDAELNWTGNTSNCTAGTMSESVRAKQLQKINYYRALVGGLNPITLEEVKNNEAMAAVPLRPLPNPILLFLLPIGILKIL